MPKYWAPEVTVTTRGSGLLAISGNSPSVSAMCPRWFTASCHSWPWGLRRRGGAITPALLINRSSCGMRSLITATALRTDCRSPRSSSRTSSPVQPSSISCWRAIAARSRFRQAITTLAPFKASCRVVSRPRPMLAPVTRATRPLRAGMLLADHPIAAHSSGKSSSASSSGSTS